MKKEETNLLEAEDVWLVADKLFKKSPPPRPPLQSWQGATHEPVVLGAQRLGKLVPLEDSQAEPALALANTTAGPEAPLEG